MATRYPIPFMAKTLAVSPKESIVYCTQKALRCKGIMHKQTAIS